jgi:hypothetical protein
VGAVALLQATAPVSKTAERTMISHGFREFETSEECIAGSLLRDTEIAQLMP